MENVYQFREALDKGCEPREYPYQQAPIGEVLAKLDFKIWGRNGNSIACYFSGEPPLGKFQISVFPRKSDDQHKLDDEGLDFRTCPVGGFYRLRIERNTKQNPVLRAAELESVDQ